MEASPAGAALAICSSSHGVGVGCRLFAGASAVEASLADRGWPLSRQVCVIEGMRRQVRKKYFWQKHSQTYDFYGVHPSSRLSWPSWPRHMGPT